MNPAPSESAIGIVGLGLVGSAYASLLAAAGNRPFVVQRDPEASLGDAADDVRGRLTLEELAQTCPVAIICVYSTAQARDVVRALSDAARAGASSLHTVLCATTLDPEGVGELYSIAEKAGLTFIEYPVSGTSVQIRAGDGLGLLSGNRERIEAQRPLIEILTPRWHVLGGPKSASLAKLAVNLVLEVNRSALAEGLVFATALGLDVVPFLPALTDSAAYSRVMEGKAPKMISGDFSAEGRATQSLKDVEMMLAQGTLAGQGLPLLSTQAELLRSVVAAGEGELDSSVVYRAIARMRA